MMREVGWIAHTVICSDAGICKIILESFPCFFSFFVPVKVERLINDTPALRYRELRVSVVAISSNPKGTDVPPVLTTSVDTDNDKNIPPVSTSTRDTPSIARIGPDGFNKTFFVESLPGGTPNDIDASND